MIRKRRASLSLSSSRRSSLHTFFLPGLLPEDRCLLLDTHTNVALLLSVKHTELAQSFALTPAAARVFFLLLQEYPRPASYQALFQLLYPLAPEQAADSVWDRTLAMRPIRRAIVKLTPLLRHVGLRLVSLRGQGYLLSPCQEQGAVMSPEQAAP